MMKLALAASAAALIVASPALAQEVDRSWTGFYVGGQAGYGFQPGDGDETILFDTNLDGSFGDNVNTSAGANAFSPGFCGGTALGATPGDGCRGDRDRIEYGAHAGFDYETEGGIVLGIVGDYNRSRQSDSVSAFSTTPARYTMTRRLRDVFSLRARAGVSAGSRLLYGTAGVVRGSIRNSFTTSNAVNSFTGNGNEKGWGYAVGGGLEQRLGANFSVGLQYLYRSIDAGDYVVRAGPGTAGLTNPFRIVNPNGTDFARSDDDFTSHGVNLTASFRF
ncbi:MAG TPA: outer membrane beta-barrel protein [Allosphingosinicella sp.]|jgi:outer membrane immunogenic protein